MNNINAIANKHPTNSISSTNSGRQNKIPINKTFKNEDIYINTNNSNYNNIKTENNTGENKNKMINSKNILNEIDINISQEKDYRQYINDLSKGNNDTNFKLHILNDVVQYLDLDKVPENISVEIVEKIDNDCFELEKDVY